jgi:hypothetical protein
MLERVSTGPRRVRTPASISCATRRCMPRFWPFSRHMHRSRERVRCKSASSYALLATASLCERGPDGWCKKLDQGRDVRDRFNIEDGLLNRRLAI